VRRTCKFKCLLVTNVLMKVLRLERITLYYRRIPLNPYLSVDGSGYGLEVMVTRGMNYKRGSLVIIQVVIMDSELQDNAAMPHRDSAQM
jgi:hypothetical protein